MTTPPKPVTATLPTKKPIVVQQKAMTEAEARRVMGGKSTPTNTKTAHNTQINPRDEIAKLTPDEQTKIKKASTFKALGLPASKAEEYLKKTDDGQELLKNDIANTRKRIT